MEQQPEQTPMIEMPNTIREQMEASRADREVVDVAETTLREAGSRAIAESINDTRPAGMEPTLPIGGLPESTELTSSTVRSQR